MADLMRDRVIVAVGDRYDVGSEIGRGGMALVYSATDLRLRRRVAIKVLPPELAFRPEVKTRFLREAETSAGLSHPNIVSIYTVEEHEGLVFFVMSLVQGESLATRLARDPRPPLDVVRRVLAEVADALSYAHGHGIVHRDIKPDNILLDQESGRAIVTDFGIARAAEADSRLTVTGIAVGTPAYMSPEQAMGERETDGRADIYSLGIVGYQMLAGELPFVASNTPSMMMKHLSEVPRPIRERRPDLPFGMATAIDRALAKKPESRWPSASAFREALISDDYRGAAYVPRNENMLGVPGAVPAMINGEQLRQQAEQMRARGFVGLRVARDANGRLMAEVGGGPFSPDAGGNASQPPAPYPMTRKEYRRWVRAQRRGYYDSDQMLAARPVEDRIVAFRRTLFGSAGLVSMLALMNAFTSPEFAWFVFPAIGMGIRVVKRYGNLAAEGVSLKQIFRRPEPKAPPLPPAPSPEDEAGKLVPADVLAGSHGAAVRRAVADRGTIRAIVQNLAAADRDLIPEVMPTADALLERVASLAQMLHHLDADVSPQMLQHLDARIAAADAEPADAPDRERRLALLQRQRTTLRDLADRRGKVTLQLESAALALQNLRFDLLKLRSAGVQAALSDVNTATQEARALSRDIGHVIDAADEVRKL
ncbi:MAG: serine/threonine-protein kinase [Gemmatimonadaceae bacterium]